MDGLDMVARSDSRVVGLHPRQLLRPGGPLYPTDNARRVRVASLDPTEPDAGGLDIGVRFRLGHYIAEIERAYSSWYFSEGISRR
ncbi:hypothetical protein [Streptacidiphilus sp. P02-A3a]|uniref:hypothetical protein n=1 Tax=Streptacidiphilus sp. P02-A3a TaxID=2704468 RepID=UPI001CDCF235|nr:hypothetical protein [Streptacidiphilus sp. P02-A3a]